MEEVWGGPGEGGHTSFPQGQSGLYYLLFGASHLCVGHA